MLKKSKKSKRSTVRTPFKDLKKEETIQHYNAVLFEDLKSKMELVIEGMETTKDELGREMKGIECRLVKEIELLKSVVHKHSDRFETVGNWYEIFSNRIKENNLQIVELRTELKGDIDRLEKNLSDKIDTIGARLDDHESKPAAVAHPA
jgi:hypothetical protein